MTTATSVRPGKCALPDRPFLFVAGILQQSGGLRVVCTEHPWSYVCHLGAGERLFLVPRWRVPSPIHYNLWPLTVGAAEIHVATSIWPERLQQWGTWEAEKYFREQVLPHMPTGNRPAWWWQQPSQWAMQ